MMARNWPNWGAPCALQLTANMWCAKWNLRLCRRYGPRKDLTRRYVLTPLSRVILEKLTGLNLVKKTLAIYGTGRYITTFTSAHQVPLSSATPIQAIHPRHTSWRSILISSSHLCVGLPIGSFPPKTTVHASYLPPNCVTCCTHDSRFYHLHNIGLGVQIAKLLIMTFSLLPWVQLAENLCSSVKPM
jgi:hypothetical protein